MTEDQSQGDFLESIAGGAIWSFGGRLSKLFFMFLVEILMARLLGLSSYGGITLAVVALNLGTTVASLGLQRGIGRKLPYYENDEGTVRGALWAALSGGLAGGIVVGGALFLAAPVLATTVFDDPNTATLFRIVGLALPFSVLITMGVSTAKAFNDATTHVFVRQLFLPIAKSVAVPLLIVAGFGVVGAAVGIAVTTALAGLLALYLGLRHFPFELRGSRNPMSREMLAFSVPLMLASGMQFIVTNTDTVLVGVYLASAQVGVYNAALKLMNLAWLFFYPVTMLLGPALTRLDRDDRLGEAKRTYQVSVKWMSLLTFPVFLLLFLFPEVVIGVTFGADAAAGANALRLLVVPVMFSVLMGANDGALVSFGHNRIHMYGNAATALLNVALNLLLIPRFGIVGAAIATATSLGMRNVIYSARLYQCHGVHPFSGALVRSIGATLPVVVVGYLLFVRLFPVRFLTVTAVGLAFLAVYAALVVRVGGIEQEDIEVIERFEKSSGANLDPLRSVVKRVQT